MGVETLSGPVYRRPLTRSVVRLCVRFSLQAKQPPRGTILFLKGIGWFAARRPLNFASGIEPPAQS